MKKSQLYSVIFIGSALLLALLLLPVQGGENLYASVIRIHVLARSDAPEDQARKLLVRDALLAYVDENFHAETLQEAKEALTKEQETLALLASKVLEKEGCRDKVKVSLGEEYYPTRHYEHLSLPAGKYLSLKVQIGEGEGQNWWCVLFPPLCLSGSVETEELLLDAGMEEENVSTVIGGEKYRIRFKLLELWGKAKRELEELF